MCPSIIQWKHSRSNIERTFDWNSFTVCNKLNDSMQLAFSIPLRIRQLWWISMKETQIECFEKLRGRVCVDAKQTSYCATQDRQRVFPFSLCCQQCAFTSFFHARYISFFFLIVKYVLIQLRLPLHFPIEFNCYALYLRLVPNTFVVRFEKKTL